MRQGTSRSRRLLVVAVAAALTVVLALLVVDDAFVPRRAFFDLEHPERFVRDPATLTSSSLGYFQWPGRSPLRLHLGRLEPGDHVTLKLRTAEGAARVRATVGDTVQAVLSVTPTWRRLEVAVTTTGRNVTLSQDGASPVSVHFSRVSYSNIRGALEGPAPVWFTDPQIGREGPPPLLPAALLGLLAGLLVARAGRRGDRPGRSLLPVAPALVVLGAVAARWLVGGPRPHVSTLAFLALLLLPGAAAVAARLPRRARAALATVARQAPPRSPGRVVGWLSAPLLRPSTAGPVASHRRCLTIHLALVAVGLVLVAGVVVRELHGPLVGDGDLDQWTFQASYVAHNLSLLPLPHLDLVSDQLFFPYGGDNVYQPWALEMHLATTLGSRVAPAWGWLQLYFLATLAITGVGAFLLLAPEFGPRRAAVVGLMLAFFNFYALGKFPGHLGIACVHWTTLNLLADAVMVRRVVQRRPLTARFLALRAVLLLLALGQDLSYVAGVALTSFVVVSLYLAVLVAARARFSPSGIRTWLAWQRNAVASSFRQRPRQVGVLVVATAALTWLWVPLVLDIVRASSLYDFHNVPNGCWWANPARMLAPVLPGVRGWLERALGDTPEGLFAASPGLLFVLPAVVALIAARRRHWAVVAPFVVLLGLFLSFNPASFAFLKLLPWFAFARVSGRLSVAYPTLLAIVALSLPRDALRRPFSRVAAALLILLAAAEVTTAYATCASRKPPAVVDPALVRFAATIRQTPGEAVLDWPYCLVGGNGVGGDSTGAFYGRLAGISVLQAFHGKKIVGKYFGRLHPDQLAPYLGAGWGRMFMPDDLNSHRAHRQRRDFTSEQWRFLVDFLNANDFAGIVLYTDLLPPETVAGFHARFGAPVARYRGPPWGAMEFIPKSAALRSLVDPARGRLLALGDAAVPWPVGLRVSDRDGSVTDYLGNGWVRCRTAGPIATLRFALTRIEPLALTLKLRSFGSQHLEVGLNGAPLEVLRLSPGSRVTTLMLPAGRLTLDNTVRFESPAARPPAAGEANLERQAPTLAVEWMRLGAHRAPLLRPGETLRADAPAAEDSLRSGWSPPRDGARTTVGERADILFAVPEIHPLALVLCASTFGDQRVAVELNGTPLTTLHGLGGGPHEVTVDLPAGPLAADNVLRLQLPDAAPSPGAHATGHPQRRGLTLLWLKLQPTSRR